MEKQVIESSLYNRKTDDEGDTTTNTRTKVSGTSRYGYQGLPWVRQTTLGSWTPTNLATLGYAFCHLADTSLLPPYSFPFFLLKLSL